MMACIGQVSNALPPSFSCLTATTPSGHRNTHRHVTPSPSATLALMTTADDGHVTTMETGGQRWHDVAVTMDNHNDDWRTKDNVKNETGNNGQQHGCASAPPLPLPPPSFTPCVLLASHCIFSQLDTCFPYVRISETGPQLVLNQLRLRLVETSLSTIENWQKPHWTSWCWFSPVFRGSSTCEDQSCQILTKDQTGPDFQALLASSNQTQYSAGISAYAAYQVAHNSSFLSNASFATCLHVIDSQWSAQERVEIETKTSCLVRSSSWISSR